MKPYVFLLAIGVLLCAGTVANAQVQTRGSVKITSRNAPFRILVNDRFLQATGAQVIARCDGFFGVLNGTCSLAEYSGVLRRRHPGIPQVHITFLFNQYDRNKDGIISNTE